MFDLIIAKDLTEVIGRNLTFPDIESIGKYIFRNYNSHSLKEISETLSISPFNAAKTLVQKCRDENRLNDLFCFIIGLDGGMLNGKRIGITGIEHLLNRFTNAGLYFDFNKRRLVSRNYNKKLRSNWNWLKDGKEYLITIASIDICGKPGLAEKYTDPVIEETFYVLWKFIRKKCELSDGRIWSRSGDGSIMAFRSDENQISGVSCCMEILFSLPVFNSSPLKKIPDEIRLRIGIDSGMIKFHDRTGKIVSDVINHATKLEKTATCPNGLSVSESVYSQLSPAMQKMFKTRADFNGKPAYKFSFDHSRALS